MVICPFICRTHFMSKNVTGKLGSTPGRPRVDPGSTLTFELYFFDIKWILQLNGQIIIKFLLWESIMLLILNQSPRGRIFRFHYLFPITLKREKKMANLGSNQKIFWIANLARKCFGWRTQGRPVDLKIIKKFRIKTRRYEHDGVECKSPSPGGSIQFLKLFLISKLKI